MDKLDKLKQSIFRDLMMLGVTVWRTDKDGKQTNETSNYFANKIPVLNKFAPYLNKEVIVLDNGNYNSQYAEPVPFKAVLYEITDYPCYWVRSSVTGKEYELYESSIMEFDPDWEEYYPHLISAVENLTKEHGK